MFSVRLLLPQHRRIGWDNIYMTFSLTGPFTAELSIPDRLLSKLGSTHHMARFTRAPAAESLAVHACDSGGNPRPVRLSGDEGHQRACVQQGPTHLLNPARCFGLVERSRGPRTEPQRSSIKSRQVPLPGWLRCCSSAWRTRADFERRNSRACRVSHAAKGGGSFTETVLMGEKVILN